MTINELIDLAQNRLIFLNNIRGEAVRMGDATRVEQLDEEIIKTQLTLDQLRTLV